MGSRQLVKREADAIHWLNCIEIDAKRVIEELPTYSAETVLEIRQQASILGTMAWRVAFAADAEIMRRVGLKLAGQSRDQQSQDIAKAVREQAAAVGVTERHIRRNALAHQLFMDIYVRDPVGAELLDQPTYWYLANETDDPEGTIHTFIEEKSKVNSKFNVGDAVRWVKEGKTPNLDDVLRPALETEEAKTAYFNWRRACAELIRAVPEWRGMISGQVDDMEYEASRPSEKWREKIEAKILLGFNTVQLLAKEFGLDRMQCQVMLNRLKEDGTLIAEEQARAPGARGAAQIMYSLNPNPDAF